MKGDSLPLKDHVVRYVGGSKIDGEEVDPDGFEDMEPSVNWLEFHQGNKEEQIARVRNLIRLRLRSTARFAELNVNAIRRIWHGLDVVEDPLPAEGDYLDDPSHAKIVGIPQDRQQLIYEALADNVIALHPAVLSF